MQVLYNTCWVNPWLKVAGELHKTHDLKPVYWIGYDDNDAGKIIPDAFPGVIYHRYWDAWRGIFPATISEHYQDYHLDVDLLKDLACYELQAVKIMDRMDPDRHSFPFAERQRLFRNMLRYWTGCLKSLKVDLVISSIIPHRTYDYALYLVCRHLGIRFLSLYNTVFPGRGIFIRDLAGIDENIKNDYGKYLASGEDLDSISARLNDVIKSKWEKGKKDYGEAIPAYMLRHAKTQKANSNRFKVGINFLKTFFREQKRFLGGGPLSFSDMYPYWKMKDHSIEESRFNVIRYALMKNQALRYKKDLADHYRSITVAPDFTKPYVYVAMHYQPEATTNPAGDIFVDHFLIFDVLLKHLPLDWKIYVKENPLQYQAASDGQTNRTIDFFKDAVKYPRISFVPLSTNSFDLIDNSQAVVTITGTVGWEAMVRKKPVIIFGLSWYEEFDGVLKITNEKDAQKLEDFISGFRYDEYKLACYLLAIQANSIVASYYKGSNPFNLPEEESVKNLVNSITRQILR